MTDAPAGPEHAGAGGAVHPAGSPRRRAPGLGAASQRCPRAAPARRAPPGLGPDDLAAARPRGPACGHQLEPEPRSEHAAAAAAAEAHRAPSAPCCRLRPPSPPAPPALGTPGPARSAPVAAAPADRVAPAAPTGAPVSKPRPLHVLFGGPVVRDRQEEFVIGRGQKFSDLAIKDANISRRHASVVRRGNDYFIKDLGGTNGIEFEGQRVDNHKVNDGVYFLCDHELRFTFTPPNQAS